MKLNDLRDVIEIDIKSSLARFGNMESFYVKYLKKFIDDKSFENLKQALENNDIGKVGEEAHTLKGVAGNLGLTKIYKYSMEIMELAKENSVDKIKSVTEKLEEEMSKVVEVLKKLD